MSTKQIQKGSCLQCNEKMEYKTYYTIYGDHRYSYCVKCDDVNLITEKEYSEFQ